MVKFESRIFDHVVGGGIAGTVGAVVTCPLEVVKTRLQSSVTTWNIHTPHICTHSAGGGGNLLHFHHTAAIGNHLIFPRHTCTYLEASNIHVPAKLSIYGCLKYIGRVEGVLALFKGFSMTLVGVLPSRALFFGAYYHGQNMFSAHYPHHSHYNIVCSAAFAGFVSSTLTNPLWFIKTRLQLDQSPGGKALTVSQCVKNVYSKKGILGFYKGIQASYFGISETCMHFVIYEHLKSRMIERERVRRGSKIRNTSLMNRFYEVTFCSLAGFVSKTIAAVTCYPHEVARTRLRQEGTKYTGFFQCLKLVLAEEGIRGMYKGMATHLVRQIPNTVIVLTTYETVLYFIRSRS